MPYKIENNYISNNISFIIAFNNETNKLFFYFYNFDINGVINEPNEIKFNDMNIQNKMIRCSINSNLIFIICFYYSKINKNELYFSKFIINDMNLILGNTPEINYGKILNEINQIKLAKSFNDKYFVTISNDGTPFCLINENSYEFKEILFNFDNKWDINYKVLYFNETDDFMFVSRWD